ncbi:acyl-CoA dehydrogenase family protein [Thermodesulfobacteriota bacterium]
MMDFEVPCQLLKDRDNLRDIFGKQVTPHLAAWYREGAVPASLFSALGNGGLLGFEMAQGSLEKHPALEGSLVAEELAKISPGVAVSVLAHVDLGLTGLWLFGSPELQEKYGPSAIAGETLLCLGNSESGAGSDVAGISTRAEKVDGGWYLEGTKAYVTNGLISNFAVVTAISDPNGDRSSRLSMFLVDLGAEGVSRRKLHKQVWIPSDLTRIQFDRVFVPDDHLMGVMGKGLQQVLRIFTYSRVPISALTLGTASGAFEMAVEHAGKREVFGRKIVDHQAKAFEIADFYAKIEATRLLLQRACWRLDQGDDFRLDSSLAKYFAVKTAREVTQWAADLFGAASVINEHPIHKFPMDAWASSLGEGTQDVQKLVIFREVMKNAQAQTT